MVAGILWTGIVVLAIMELFELVKRKLLFWTKAN
jgi:NitT/TauT family transport system permease protein